MLRRHIDPPSMQEYVWPELLRYQLRAHHFSPYGFDQDLDHKLSICTPATFATSFSYDQKIHLLLKLVGALHHLDSLKQHMQDRLYAVVSADTRAEVWADIKAIIKEREEYISNIS